MIEIFTVGGGEYIVNVLNAVAAWTGAGGYKSEEACPDACVDGVGCKPCAPDTFQCVDELSQKCSNNYEWAKARSWLRTTQGHR